MGNFVGTLIRRERLRQNLSQEGLCRGVCAVSYLSKIEQGKAEAGDDVLLPLLRRLGIECETDGEFLSQARASVESLYEDLFSGMSGLPPFHEKLELVERQLPRYLASPYMLDILLLRAVRDHDMPEGLAEFIPCMTSRQYQLYLLLKLYSRDDGAAEELLRLNPCSFFTCSVGMARYWRGRYPEAIDLLSRGYDLAAREGHVYLMCTAKLFLGNCYCDSGQKELTLEHYRVARRLAAALQGTEEWLADIDYNVASTYLEQNMAEEALRLLQGLKRRDGLYFHKLAVALEKLGRREEALKALESARAAEAHGPEEAVMGEMLDLVEYRLRHPDYLRDGTYPALMESVFSRLRRDMPSGFVRFHLPYMLEALEAERRYKDAYRLSLEFSYYISS